MRTRRWWFPLVLAALLATPSTSFRAQAPPRAGGSTVSRNLVGSWRLVTWADRRQPDGPWTHQFGEHPVGLFIYTADGHISIQVMRGGPPEAASPAGTTPARGGEGLGPFHAYFGTFTVDEAKHIVVHHVAASENPNMVGTDQPREFRLEGDRLIIGDEKRRLRILERLKPLPELLPPSRGGRQ